MRFTWLIQSLLGLAVHHVNACNEIGFGSVQPQDCFVDPNDGSKYGVYAAVYNPCAQNEVLYLSLSYTAPNGYETRTETSAQMGTISPFTTTFTFDIPQTFFVDSAVISQTFQIDNTPAASSATRITRKRWTTSNFLVPRVSTSTRIVQSTLTYTYVATYSEYVTIPHTTTSPCTGGTKTVATITSSTTETITSTTPASVVYTPSTTTLTTTIPCTLAGGGLPNPFRPREGQYETDFCPSKQNAITTYYSTGDPTTSTSTSTFYYESNVLLSTYTTITFSDITKTECVKPTATVTYTYTKVIRTITTPPGRATTTSPSYVYKYSTVGRSQC